MVAEPLKNLAQVYLVEDSLSDVILTKAILKTKRIHFELEVFRDGSELISNLNLIPEEEHLPDLILLDFNLPKVSGEQVLAFMQKDPILKTVPVIMLSGSDAPTDQAKTEALGAIDFMVKPLDEERLQEVLQKVPQLNFYQQDDSWYLVNVDQVARAE